MSKEGEREIEREKGRERKKKAIPEENLGLLAVELRFI